MDRKFNDGPQPDHKQQQAEAFRRRAEQFDREGNFTQGLLARHNAWLLDHDHQTARNADELP
jgi:hypothetical protein